MKNIIKYTLLLISGYLIWYFPVAFTVLEMNAENWDIESRGLVAIMGTATSLAGVLIYQLNKD